VIKVARSGSKYLTDHLLSFIVFAAAAAEFAMLPKFGTSIFLLLTLLALVEFFSGIALHTRRTAPAAARAGKRVEPAVVEPRPVPQATPVAEASPVERPEPKLAGPTVASPDLQPGSGPSAPSVKP
jgi:hypothetical protein